MMRIAALLCLSTVLATGTLGAEPAQGAPAAPAAEDKPEDAPGKRKVRAVGPNIYPVR